MMDRFLGEIRDMHQLRKDTRSLPPAKAEEFMMRLGDEAADDWVFRARDAQLPPSDLSWCWLFLGGRGAGKSHSMSAAVHMAVRAGISRIHLIAPTTADFHDVNLEGRSGILATCGRDPRPRWVSSKRRLEWPNGAMCVFFSGEEPESLRGPQCELCVIDEIGRMRYQLAVFDNMMLGLRLGDMPRVLIATTPRTTPFMKRLVTMDDIRITSGSTYDNADHLSPAFLHKVRELYEGTRLGRQELQGCACSGNGRRVTRRPIFSRPSMPTPLMTTLILAAGVTLVR
jgi:phage terminase large subunit-like protein